MMFPSSLLVAFIAFFHTNSVVSQLEYFDSARIAYNDEQCRIENKILQNDTELSRLYPRNVSCDDGDDDGTDCAIDIDYVTGVDEYHMRCYQLRGRISLVNIEQTESCNSTNGENGTIVTTNPFSFTNDPLCLGSNCSRDTAYQQHFQSDRTNELLGSTCPYKMRVFEKTSLSGPCAAETYRLRKKLIEDAEFGSPSEEYSTQCQAFGGQSFVIASNSVKCEQTKAGNESYGGSASAEPYKFFCFGASCTFNEVMVENQFIRKNYEDSFYFLINLNGSCLVSYNTFAAVNSDADRSWSLVPTSIVALAVAVSVSFM
jgi:hypothetical protein